ncbi:hypothetical protein Tco_0439119 [Tanacetum coccineum]
MTKRATVNLLEDDEEEDQTHVSTGDILKDSMDLSELLVMMGVVMAMVMMVIVGKMVDEKCDEDVDNYMGFVDRQLPDPPSEDAPMEVTTGYSKVRIASRNLAKYMLDNMSPYLRIRLEIYLSSYVSLETMFRKQAIEDLMQSCRL